MRYYGEGQQDTDRKIIDRVHRHRMEYAWGCILDALGVITKGEKGSVYEARRVQRLDRRARESAGHKYYKKWVSDIAPANKKVFTGPIRHGRVAERARIMAERNAALGEGRDDTCAYVESRGLLQPDKELESIENRGIEG